jgi:tetratricopeptide (TPR) repeat protein
LINDKHPELAQANKVLGDIYYQKRDYRNAIKVYTESIQYKDTGIARHARGQAYREERQYDKALKDFEQATFLDDGRAWADFDLEKAILLAFRNHFVEADLAHEHATRLDPRNACAFFCWGRTSASARNFRKAIKEYGEAINLEPRSDFYFYRGQAYCYLGIKNPLDGEFQKAIVDYTEAINGERKDPETYVARGNAYRWTSEYRLAILDFSEAIKLTQKVSRSKDGEAFKKQAYLGRSESYLRLSEFEKALQDASMAISIDPQDRNARALQDQASREKSLRDSVR